MHRAAAAHARAHSWVRHHEASTGDAWFVRESDGESVWALPEGDVLLRTVEV